MKIVTVEVQIIVEDDEVDTNAAAAVEGGLSLLAQESGMDYDWLTPEVTSERPLED